MQSIEERVAALEHVVFSRDRKVGKNDWKATLGMFDDDPIMKEIIDEALMIREEERRLARLEYESELPE
jgi:hypothetical protein